MGNPGVHHIGDLVSIDQQGRRVWRTGFTPKVIWSIVKQAASNSGLSRVAPHDLRRTCAKLCHEAGGELGQIQFLLGHVSVQTTERYQGCKQTLSQCSERSHRLGTGLIMSPRSIIPCRLRRTNPAGGGRTTTMLRLSALGLGCDPRGSVKQIHHEELEDGEKERPSAFPKIMLKQADSRIQ